MNNEFQPQISSGTDPAKDKKKIIIGIIVLILVVAISAGVFFVVLYSISKNKGNAKQGVFEMPPSPVSAFPPAPNFQKIGQYYFDGPYSLQQQKVVLNSMVYVISCGKGDDAQIFYAGLVDKSADLSKNKSYACWSEKCSKGVSEVYLYSKLLSSEKDSLEIGAKIQNDLILKFKPACQPQSASAN
jgi:hypothetical protein